MARILVVDDEPGIQRILTLLLEQHGHAASVVGTAAAAKERVASQSWDLVITDQRLPDANGLAVLKACQDSDPTLAVIMITAYATVELAVQAMREGAFDFITKPFDPESTMASVERACGHTSLLRENARLRNEVERFSAGQELLGQSAALDHLRSVIARVAPTDATVLITGETGTGKELVARAIHQGSRRARKPFVAVNCAAMPEPLLESQLFGHERGAFTGAERAHQGLFETADGGTLFLDEAGEMSLGLQAKLLRVLVDKQVVRIGATTPRQVDVRIVVATHRNLEERVKNGQFREDLYFRIAVIPIAIPPLRERPEDIAVLLEHFLKRIARELKVQASRVTPEALSKLEAYGFPGNVRELRNLIERAYILSGRSELRPEDFLVAAEAQATGDAPGAPRLETALEGDGPHSRAIDLKDTLEQYERSLIIQALERAGGAQAEAARRLNISRSDMAYKVKKYQLRSFCSA